MTEPGKTKQRSCIACGKKASKGDLLRVVRTSDGSAAFDATSRAAGRGAYVCSAACLADARKSHKLERALRTKLDQQAYDRIEADVVSALRRSQGIVEE
ncbi:MAG TPA: YlxR family protein [Candidatus Aphodovivens excrementavium]|nr:YlxR family protein [Candidatus Aphodovivens excrementavium]